MANTSPQAWNAARPAGYVVFYDGRCQICRAIRTALEWLEADAPLRFVDVNDRKALAAWPRIDPDAAQREVSVIDPRGRLTRGYRASLVLSFATMPALRPLRPLLESSPAEAVGQRLYRLVSDRRDLLSNFLFPFRERRPEREARPDRETGGVMPIVTRDRSTQAPSQPTPKPHPAPPQRTERGPATLPPAGDVARGVLAGAVAGLVGSWTMNQLHTAMSKLSQSDVGEQEQSEQQEDKPEPATVKAARKIVEDGLGHPMSDREKKIAGPVMHYGFGAAVGALYGGLAELTPVVTRGGGTFYGGAVWVGADEIVVPASGLSGPPTEQPASVHVEALGAHLVYGVSLELTRKAIRRWLL
ncbi:MAG: DUF1440 domain-containing protein [Phycisphaeraceae bacterium]